MLCVRKLSGQLASSHGRRAFLSSPGWISGHRSLHSSSAIYAKKKKVPKFEEEDDEPEAEQETPQHKSYNIGFATTAKSKAPSVGHATGWAKVGNFWRFIMIPVGLIGAALLWLQQTIVVDSSESGFDDLVNYLVGEVFDMAASNNQVMQKLGGQMSTDDRRIKVEDKVSMFNMIIPLYGQPPKLGRCEVEFHRTQDKSQLFIFSARVVFPGGDVVRLDPPATKFGGSGWEEEAIRLQEERAEKERQAQLARMQSGMRPLM